MPILALRTEQDISNQLILQPRWDYVRIAVLLAFFGAAALSRCTRRRPLPRAAQGAPAAPDRSFMGRAFRSSGLVVLLLYPLAGAGARRPGRRHQVDR